MTPENSPQRSVSSFTSPKQSPITSEDNNVHHESPIITSPVVAETAATIDEDLIIEWRAKAIQAALQADVISSELMDSLVSSVISDAIDDQQLQRENEEEVSHAHVSSPETSFEEIKEEQSTFKSSLSSLSSLPPIGGGRSMSNYAMNEPDDGDDLYEFETFDDPPMEVLSSPIPHPHISITDCIGAIFHNEMGNKIWERLFKEDFCGDYVNLSVETLYETLLSTMTINPKVTVNKSWVKNTLACMKDILNDIFTQFHQMIHSQERLDFKYLGVIWFLRSVGNNHSYQQPEIQFQLFQLLHNELYNRNLLIYYADDQQEDFRLTHRVNLNETIGKNNKFGGGSTQRLTFDEEPYGTESIQPISEFELCTLVRHNTLQETNRTLSQTLQQNYNQALDNITDSVVDTILKRMIVQTLS